MEQTQLNTRPQRRSPVQRNRRLQGQYLSWLLIGTVLFFTVLTIALPDKDFSESENRKLATFPSLTISSALDGSFLSGLSDYVADQFPGRDLWISVNLGLNRLLGQKEASGVYLCDDDYLMQIPSAPNETQLQRNLEAIDAFTRSHDTVHTTMTVVPNAVTIHADKLPKNAPVRDQLADLSAIKAALSNVNFVDVTETMLAHSDEQLFYRTDHHWTSLGAYYAYGALATSLNVPYPSWSEFTRYTVSDTFEGTLSSKSGSHAALDVVEIYVPKTNIEYFVTYGDDQTGICSMYSRAALDTKDHYTVFFGGNYGRVDITTSADTGRVLLVFKDSYANCFIQFLYPYFDQIIMIDPRYYYDNVENVLRSQSVTDILYLYNLDTFLGDTSLADVLAAN